MYYSLVKSPLGWLGVVAGPKGVHALYHAKKKTQNKARFRRALEAQFPGVVEKNNRLTQTARSFLQAYFKQTKAPLPSLDLTGQSSFEKRVLKSVQKIPSGEVRSYAWLAREIGSPEGARACGLALRQNPFPLFVPCHRIVRKTGALGGFSWGKGIKKRLIQLEQRGFC